VKLFVNQGQSECLRRLLIVVSFAKVNHIVRARRRHVICHINYFGTVVKLDLLDLTSSEAVR
jgi:hypothetical protein